MFNQNPIHDISNKFNLFLKVVLIPLVVVNGFVYLLGSFIAQDFEFTNWWAYRTTFGRVLLSLIEIIVLVNIPKWWGEYNKK